MPCQQIKTEAVFSLHAIFRTLGQAINNLHIVIWKDRCELSSDLGKSDLTGILGGAKLEDER